MDANKAIWLKEVLNEQEKIQIDWRVLKKYSDDYDENKQTEKNKRAQCKIWNCSSSAQYFPVSIRTSKQVKYSYCIHHYNDESIQSIFNNYKWIDIKEVKKDE